MKVVRVDQRRYDDCLRACAAMVLGIDYEDTPDVEPEAVANEDFWTTWEQWAASRGLVMLFYSREHPVHLRRWIATVPSLTMPGKDHVVVMRRTGLFHDPCRTEKRDHVSPGDVKYGIALLPEAEEAAA